MLDIPRTATIEAVSPCLLLELSQKGARKPTRSVCVQAHGSWLTDFRHFISLVPEILERFNDKLSQYNISLRHCASSTARCKLPAGLICSVCHATVIHNPIVLNAFIKHLDGEFSRENIDFWYCLASRLLLIQF
jgi:hypothetical protein